MKSSARRLTVQAVAIRKVLLQLVGIGAYFALVVILYWRGLTDLGAVAIVVGLLFFFTTVVKSGAISLAHLSPADPQFNIRSPAMELLKVISFFGIGMGIWIDLGKALQIGLVPPNLPTAIIHVILVCVFAICIACCCARFSVALKKPPKA
jgi:hypothetical protein